MNEFIMSSSAKLLETKNEDPVTLICQFFIHKDKNRNEEIRQCLKRNVENEHIDKIILLNEKKYTDDELGIKHKKIRQVNINKILTYKDVFTLVDDLMLRLALPASENKSTKEIRMTSKEYNDKITRKRCCKKDGDITCVLSMEKIKRGHTIAITECGHKFKSKELRTWLTKKCVKPTCPMCRKNLKA